MSGIYAKYHVQIMLLFVYTTTRKRFVIFTSRYFKLSWNATALSQSNCSNFSWSSINCCLEVCLVSAGYQSVAVSYLVPYHRHVSLLCWIKTIATWKKWLKVCSLKEWTIIERHLPDFSLSILAILLDIRDGETLAKWSSRASIATHPSTDTEWSPKLLTRFSIWRIELHNDMQEGQESQ